MWTLVDCAYKIYIHTCAIFIQFKNTKEVNIWGFRGGGGPGGEGFLFILQFYTNKFFYYRDRTFWSAFRNVLINSCFFLKDNLNYLWHLEHIWIKLSYLRCTLRHTWCRNGKWVYISILYVYIVYRIYLDTYVLRILWFIHMPNSIYVWYGTH